jgi:ribosome biogenesis protein BRX1
MSAPYKRLKHEQQELANLESAASSGAPLEIKKNKQRVLVLASRGITQRYRHLMEDVLTLLPHSVKESKFDQVMLAASPPRFLLIPIIQKHDLPLINELCEARNCNNCIFFETRKHKVGPFLSCSLFLCRYP